MTLLWEGIIVEQPKWLKKEYDPCLRSVVPGELDEHPVTIFAIQAWVGLVWWVVTWFTYVKNVNNLKSGSGTDTVPLFWFWEFAGDVNYGWTAASYMTTFFMHLLVSFTELIAWFFYMGSRPNLLVWWTGNLGWYLSTIGMIFPWLFAIFQLSFNEEDGGMENDTTIEGSYNALFLLAGNLFAWLNASSTHIMLGERLACHVKMTEPQRAKTVYKKCPIKRTFGTTNREY